MENIQKVTANDLFMLIYNLSQMTDNKKVVEVFSQALQELFPEYSISYLKPGTINISNVLKISTIGCDYGFIALGLHQPTTADHDLLQNICTMLALILRKNEQSRLLENEKLHLTSLVEERTLHLVEQIEEQKKITNTLNESLEKFRILYETMTQGVVYQSSNGYITSANPAAERILGLSLDQMQGRTSMNPEWRAIREDGSDLPGSEHPAMVALRTRKPVLEFIQGIFNPRINAHVWMRVDSIPQFKGNSKIPNQVISIFSDITVQLGLNERLRDLVSAVKNLSSAHTLDEIQKIAATSARILTKCDGATLVLREGDTCYYAGEDAISPLWKGQKFPISDCISGWVMLNKTVAIIPDIYNDKRVPIETYKSTFVKSLAMIPVNMESPIAAIGNYWNTPHTPSELDIQLLQTLADAAAKAIENVLLLRDLEHRVRCRTFELESAVKELESFSYSVSHDLRAPLRAIDGYVRILMENFSTTLGDEGKRICNVISDSARNMGKLIDNLLAFSRLGKASMELSNIDMKQMVEELFKEISTATEHVAFEVGSMPSATGDPALVRQVWTNLISNAVKFSSKNESVKIKVKAEIRDEEVIYSISDNGVGFDMKYTDKLFGVFQRLHSQKEFEGTGVGLAIVQRIISRHGGKIWAEAELGKGATFFFTLRTGYSNEQ